MGAIYLSGVFVLSHLDNHPDAIHDSEIIVETPTTDLKDEPQVVEKPVEKPVEEKNITKLDIQTPPKQEDTAIWTQDVDEKATLGLCPSQGGTSRLSAIGIISSGADKTSPTNSLNSNIETWWNSYREGKWDGRHMMASLNNMIEFDSTYANSRVGMFIDFNGLFVNWDNSWEDGKTINISEAQRQVLNQMASDGTNYLRWLDSTYNAKCPND